MAVTFVCPQCGQWRMGVRRRCYQCTKAILSAAARERIRRKLLGVKHTEERVAKNRDAALRGRPNQFDLGSFTRGKPSPKAKPLGAEYQNPDGRVFIKVAAHGSWHQMWKRRYHLVWEAANGPIPRGRLIHHVNEDPSDDRLENLQLVTRSEHAKIHDRIGAMNHKRRGHKA